MGDLIAGELTELGAPINWVESSDAFRLPFTEADVATNGVQSSDAFRLSFTYIHMKIRVLKHSVISEQKHACSQLILLYGLPFHL